MWTIAECAFDESRMDHRDFHTIGRELDDILLSGVGESGRHLD